MKFLPCIFLTCIVCANVNAAQIPIWPKDKMPDTLPITKPESTTVGKNLIAGKTVMTVSDVSQPTVTIYPPKVKNTGAAIVVFPGGGFHGLAMDIEGTEICDWVTSQGMTCALLKYRVPNSGPNWNEDCQCEVQPKSPTALEDAQRTLGLLRLNAEKWHLNPKKIGVIGFSAGGYMVADISTHFDKRAYSPIDSADKQSCRPDFAIALYPGHMRKKGGGFVLNPDIHFTKETPPTFLLQAEDDPVDSVDYSLLYYKGLKDAGVPVEMHLYSHGGHAFGLRKSQNEITKWPHLVELWLKANGMTN